MTSIANACDTISLQKGCLSNKDTIVWQKGRPYLEGDYCSKITVELVNLLGKALIQSFQHEAGFTHWLAGHIATSLTVSLQKKRKRYKQH